MRDIQNPQKVFIVTFFIVRNLSRRNFWWQHKFDFRKVPIEKVRFAPRIDVIAQKPTPVAPSEDGEDIRIFLGNPVTNPHSVL